MPVYSETTIGDTELLMDIDGYLSEHSRRGQFSGSVFVSHGQGIRLERGYGYAERDGRTPNTTQTAFQIASVSKQLTAAAILLLQQRALLWVDSPIGTWVPNCPEAWQSITIHHLLTHTSGIGHWRDFPDLSLFAPNTRENLIHIFQREPLKFPPGTRWSYSSPGYVLLAHIVEQVAQEEYASFLTKDIFHPLGMENTGAGNVPRGPAQLAVGYSGEERVPSFELDQVGIGAGDIWSTPGDLARWDAALASPGFLSETSLDAMSTSYVPTPWSGEDMTDSHYGYGWFIARLHGRRIFLHPGDNAGFQALNVWFPDDDCIVILLTNDDRVDLRKIAIHVASGLLDREAYEPGSA